jgi:hypothetical protein
MDAMTVKATESAVRIIVRRALVMSALIGGLLAIISRGTSPSVAGHSKLPGNPLVVDAGDLDFGTVSMQDSFMLTLPIHNPTNEPVSIQFFTTSCSCAKTNARALVVPAHGTTPVKFDIDLSPRNPEEAAVEVRPYQTWVRPNILGRDITQGWRVHGTVRALVTCKPSSISFGETTVDNQHFESQTVSLRCIEPASSVFASCESAHVQVKVTPTGSADRFELTVTPANDLPVGRFAFPISLHPTDATGRQLPSASLYATGVVAPDFYVEPSTMILNLAHAQSENDTRFQVLSHSAARADRVDVEPEDDAISIIPVAGGSPNDRFSVTVNEPLPRKLHFSRVRLTVWHSGTQSPTELYLSVVLDARKSERPMLREKVRASNIRPKSPSGQDTHS